MEESATAVVVDAPPKRGRTVRPKHPAALGTGTLTETPGDFNFDTQGRLVEKDFTEDWQFLLYRAADATHRADKFKRESELSKSLGNKADRAKVKKLVNFRDNMQTLMDSLREQGVDVDAILAAAPAKAEEVAA